jgi:hypothetical protein
MSGIFIKRNTLRKRRPFFFVRNEIEEAQIILTENFVHYLPIQFRSKYKLTNTGGIVKKSTIENKSNQNHNLS